MIIYQLLIMFLLTKADPDLIRDGVLEIEHAGRSVQHTQRLLIAIVSSQRVMMLKIIQYNIIPSDCYSLKDTSQTYSTPPVSSVP